MGLILRSAPATLEGSLRLPGAKSSSNRWLIIEALSDKKLEIIGLATAEDTRLLKQALETTEPIINVGAAGTAMRFMTAFLSQRPGTFELRGKDRAHDRPIAILVDALRALGAEITYLDKSGYPPLRIAGNKLHGGRLKIDASVSSQYLTALLLVAAKMQNGLTLLWEGDLSSAPYIAQTLEVLQQAGIGYEQSAQHIEVYPGEFKLNPVEIEPDWSSAAYWLAFTCLLPAKLRLLGLKADSLQADKRALTHLQAFGLQHRFESDGLVVWREPTLNETQKIEWDFRDCPDLAPTLIVLCAALKRQAVFTGIQSLRIKESDRLLALQTELRKFGAQLHINEASAVLVSGCSLEPTETITVNSWQDHRIAMSLSLMTAVGYALYFDTIEVVSKSYPAFWEDLAKFGFQLEQQDGR